MPEAKQTIVQVEVAIPGYTAMSGAIEIKVGDKVKLDDAAIQAHGLLNDIIVSIRRGGKVTIDGQSQD